MYITCFYFGYLFYAYFQIQGDQLNMAVFFWYLVKGDLSCVHVYRLQNRTLDKSLCTRYQKKDHVYHVSLYVAHCNAAGWGACRVSDGVPIVKKIRLPGISFKKAGIPVPYTVN